MFTGIVSEVGVIRTIQNMDGGREIQIACSFAEGTHIDESISVNGVCLTVTNQTSEYFTVQSVEETLRKTTFSERKEGDEVNLERSLTLDKALEGHMVQGHVDTVGEIREILEEGSDRMLVISYPEDFTTLIVGRGSISVDGISLTVAREEEGTFTVAIIPYTWEHTTLRNRKEGDRVNLEFDIFGKYINRYLEQRFGSRPPVS